MNSILFWLTKLTWCGSYGTLEGVSLFQLCLPRYLLKHKHRLDGQTSYLFVFSIDFQAFRTSRETLLVLHILQCQVICLPGLMKQLSDLVLYIVNIIVPIMQYHLICGDEALHGNHDNHGSVSIYHQFNALIMMYTVYSPPSKGQ